MIEQKEEYWFPAKRYGWGWGLPRTWQGWVVMSVWFAVILSGARFLAEGAFGLYGLIVAIACIVLTAIAWWKGEPPHWRWG